MQQSSEKPETRPLVSLVLPAFNEESILERNLKIIFAYLDGLADRYRWQVVLVNDGSNDLTGQIAERAAADRPEMKVLHHPRNFGLGQALKFGFSQCDGEFIVSMDIDLSYAPQHIGLLLDAIRSTHAKIVLASPYMKGGSIGNVPRLRKSLSIWANRFLSILANGRLSTLTCMVRAYDGPFIRSLNLRALGMDVMPETIYKSMVLRATIEQIPATLDWERQAEGGSRQSSMRILRHIFATLLSGFVFRPFAFFILPGLLLLSFSAYVNLWMMVHFFDALGQLPPDTPGGLSTAVANAYAEYPHTFIVGFFSLTVSVQLISLGVIALQSKNYFEEMFHLNSALKSKLESARASDASRG